MTGRKIRKNYAAFTLAELLLVVVLIVMISGIGGSMAMGSFKKARLDKAVRHFLFTAKHARLNAIERQSPCILSINTDEKAFVLFVYSVDELTGFAERVIVNDFYFKKPVVLPGDVNFEQIIITNADGTEIDNTQQETEIVFLPDGTSQRAMVQISNEKHIYTVCISAATGRAKVYPGTGEDIEPTTVDLEEQI